MKFLTKVIFFLAFLVKIFKNKKLIHKVRKYSLDTLIQMALANFLVIFVQKYFLPLFKKKKKIGKKKKKKTFLEISQIYDY